MENKLVNHPKRYSWLLWLLLFTSTDTLLFGTNGNICFLYVPRAIGMLFSFYAFYVCSSYVNKRGFFAVVFLCCWASISCFISHTGIETALSRVISIITGFSIILYYGRRTFFQIFDNFMYFISRIAIITEIIAYCIPQLFQVFPLIKNAADNTFRSFFFGSIQVASLNQTFIRNEAIFWEPGAFAIYLCIAIMLQMFAFEKINYKRLRVYMICIVLSFSTTGFIGLVALFIVFIFSSRNKVKSKYFKIASVVFLTLIVVFMLFCQDTQIYSLLFGKILENSSGAQTRYASFYNGIRIALDHPIFGIGGGNIGTTMLEYVYYTKFKSGGAMLTNTFTFYLAAFGIPFGILLMFGTYHCMKKIAENRCIGLGLFFVIGLLYCGEMFFSFLPFAISFAGFFQERGNIK